MTPAPDLCEKLEAYVNNPVMQQYAPVACELMRQAISLLRREGMTQIRSDVVQFLHGVGPLDGFHFGEKPPHERGQYWWRKYLPAYKDGK